MFQLNLTANERNVLKGVVERDLSELHRELADTNNWKLKEELRSQEATLTKIFNALDPAHDNAT